MQATTYKFLEFFIIFVVVPVSFVLHYPLVIKMIIGFVGFAYVVFVLFKTEKKQFKIADELNWKSFWNQILKKSVVIMAVTTIYVLLFDKSNLFTVVLNKPLLWLLILFIYSFFSVYPQELIYRTFYFQRYGSIFKSNTLIIFINGIVFSLAHLFFKNTLVIVLTFFGGVLFALTYQKTKSTLLVSIEHALYGCWLFTVGMGNMLGFPS